MKLRKSSRIKERRIALKPKVTSIFIKAIVIVIAMAIVSGICTGGLNQTDRMARAGGLAPAAGETRPGRGGE